MGPPQDAAVRRRGGQPGVRGARGGCRHERATHPRRGTGLELGVLRESHLPQLTGEVRSKIAGPDDPAVRCAARLNRRSEGGDQQIVPHERRGQQARPARGPERPAPACPPVAHRNERGSAPLLPPEEVAGRVAHDRPGDVPGSRRRLVHPALRTGRDGCCGGPRGNGRGRRPTQGGECGDPAGGGAEHGEPPVGFEPTTARLRIESSTTELRWRGP